MGARLLASLLLAVAMVLAPAPAAGFGTIDGGGQHREHERITRAALACPDGRDSDDCLTAASVSQLAGDGKGFGAVGAPDRTEVDVPAAHCDDADFLAGDYPRTREQATEGLTACVNHLRGRFAEGVRDAERLLDDQGDVVGAEVRLEGGCRLRENGEQRAKCTVLESFGRALHGVQDFYAHSSWADEADPDRPIGPDNPPGLNRPAPSPVLDLRGTGVPDVPRDLATGCFVLHDTVPGAGMCERRITHAALNKDNGLIDPVTGRVSEPGTPRGQVADNFQKAVTGAVVESRYQWLELRRALRDTYGPRRAAAMTCALTRDDPVRDCDDGTGSARTVIVVVAGVLGILGLAVLVFRKRIASSRRTASRRRRTRAG